MSAKKLTPIGTRLLVLPTPPPSRTGGGILLPEAWAQPTGQGTVVAIGAAVRDLKPGDTVFYSWINGVPVFHEDREMRLLDLREVLGMIEQPPAS